MKFVHLLFAVCMFVSSCEIVLTIQPTGNLHPSQIIFIVMIFLGLGKMIQSGHILWPPGGTALAWWAASQVLFLPFSGNIVVGIQFLVLMAMTLAGFFAVVQIYGRSTYVNSLLRLYLLSYVAMGVFGLIQFTGPLLGFPSMYVTQWLVHGRLARINGFTYEPSYYATYMLMGWVTLVELRASRASIVADKRWKYATVVLSTALVLSSSKTGIIMMGVELLFLSIGPAWRGSKRFIAHLGQGRLIFPLPRRSTVVQTALVLAVILGTAVYAIRHVDPLIFLEGSGLGNTAAHSVDYRKEQLAATETVVKQHPFVGRSLGGVSSQIAANMGEEVRQVSDARDHYLGFPVFVDVLAASGIFAFIPFLIFLWQTSIGACLMARKHSHLEEAKWLRALGRATIIEYMVLCVDQNLFRIYVWVHLAVVAVIAYRVKHPIADTAEASQPISLPAGLHSVQQPS